MINKIKKLMDKKPKLEFICTSPGVEKVWPIIRASDYKHAWFKKAVHDMKTNGSIAAPHRREWESQDEHRGGPDGPRSTDNEKRHSAKCPALLMVQNTGWIMRLHQDVKLKTFGDGEDASNYASLLVQSLIDPKLKVDKPQEVIDAMEGISYQGTTKGRGKVEELMAKWLPRSLWGDVKIAEHASKLRRNADYEYELIDIFQEKRYANYSMYDKEIPWENIVSNKLQAVKNVWGIDVEWDNPILDELIRMNDTTKENQYLREEGLKNGVSKVVDDLALSEVGAYGEGIVQGQAFTEGGP